MKTYTCTRCNSEFEAVEAFEGEMCGNCKYEETYE